MTYENVILSLPSDLVGTLHLMARDRSEALDDLVRRMLVREATRLRTAQTVADARENRMARLRHLLAPDMRRATDWADLCARLALYGVELRNDGGGMMLHDLITGERLCSSAALGFDRADLAGRFGGPIPAQVSAV